MSVVLSFNVCESSDCKSLIFTETTGAYNASSNITGWGSPNETTGSAISAKLIVTTPNNVSFTLDLFVTSNFPTSDNTIQYSIPFTSIGQILDSKLIDGIYNFSYTVITNTTTYNQNFQQAFYCQVKCCVDSMFKDLDVECDCNEDNKTKAINAWLLLKGLIYSGNSGNINNFNSELAVLQKLCLNNNCSDCR